MQHAEFAESEPQLEKNTQLYWIFPQGHLTGLNGISMPNHQARGELKGSPTLLLSYVKQKDTNIYFSLERIKTTNINFNFFSELLKSSLV